MSDQTAVQLFGRSYFTTRYGGELDAWSKYALARELEPQVRFLTAGNGSQPRLLDLGCGLGRVLDVLEQGSRQCFGVDVSHFALGHARRDGHAVAQALVHALPFVDARFDGVLMRDVLDLIPSAEVPRVLVELGRVLDPGGRLVLSVMNYAHPLARATFSNDPHHCTPFQPAELLAACRVAGFDGVVRQEHTIAGLPGLGVLVKARLYGPAYATAHAHARVTGRRMHAVFYGRKAHT